MRNYYYCIGIDLAILVVLYSRLRYLTGQRTALVLPTASSSRWRRRWRNSVAVPYVDMLQLRLEYVGGSVALRPVQAVAVQALGSLVAAAATHHGHRGDATARRAAPRVAAGSPRLA
jgi:hypothetical protein